MKIGWIEISVKKYGGVIYNEEARKTLEKKFDIELVSREAKIFNKIKYLKIPESLLRLIFLGGEKNLWIRDFYSTLTMPCDKTKGKNITIIHHDDFSGFPSISRPFFKILQKVFYRNLRKVDAIVTVSENWRRYFLEKGYEHVYKIYNGFNLENYNITEKEILEFKKRYKLEGKPIIYLGNCQKAKGVVESYNALKELDVYLVTSGKCRVKIPARNFDIEYRDYLCLLKASSMAITMSKFKEGWCRTLHEAMLLEIPVIGNGAGGMRELLEGGKQIICEDFKQLKVNVERLLNDSGMRGKMGADGYNFAKDFTMERFQNEWINLVKNYDNN